MWDVHASVQGALNSTAQIPVDMNRHYAILAILLHAPLLAQQVAQPLPLHPEGRHSGQAPAAKTPAGAPKGSSYYTETFDSSLNGWTVVSGVGNVDWAWTNTGPGPTSSTYPVPVLNTSTPSGWAIFDDDYLGQSGVQAGSSLISPVIDLSSAPANLRLEFDQYFQEFSDALVETWVGVSTDGGTTWNETLLNEGVGRDGRPNPELMDLNISAWVAANPANVQLRFRYLATWDYGWQLDNINISDLPNNDMGLLSARKTGFDFVNTNLADIDYSIYPVEQVRPMLLHAKVKNKGFDAQTGVVLGGSVDGPGGNEFSGISNTVAVSAPDQVDSLAVEGFTPSGDIGTYTVNITVAQNETDGNQGNNVSSETFQVDPCIWAHDDGVCQQLQTAGPDNLTDQMEVGNYFDVANDGSFLYAIEVAMHEDTPPGTLIYAVVRDENLDEVAISDEVEVDASALNGIGGSNFITILLNDPLELVQGNLYCMMVGGFGGADQISVCTSGISDAQVSILSYPQAPTPNTFYVTKTPMVRGVLSAACAGVGIDEPSGLVSGTQAWPNPFSEQVDIRFELASASDVIVEIRDMTGRLVRTESLGRRAAGTQQVQLNGAQLADGVYSYTITAGGQRTSGTLVRASR
jgi:hypothetical protein